MTISNILCWLIWIVVRVDLRDHFPGGHGHGEGETHD
jgi:hypothetical protein